MSALGIAIIVYVGALFGVALWANGRVETHEDFLVAGRRLGAPLAAATLLATWFGAGTLLTATDEIRAGGAVRAALDPIGAGVCLLLAGFFYAKKLREMNLLTLADFFRERFGPRAEFWAALLMVPSYFGWVAAQFVALAGVLHLVIGLPVAWGIFVVAVVGLLYTLLGGMWSVTLTDALQMVLVSVGVILLAPALLSHLGAGDIFAGWARLIAETPPAMLSPVPGADSTKWLAFVGVLAVGCLGNLPGQDLFQRVFSSKDAKTAQRACYLAGGLYLGLGTLVVVIGLASRLAMPEHNQGALLVALARAFLSPLTAGVFILALVSAVISTVDSALLSPAAVLAENALPKLAPAFVARVSPLFRVRVATTFVAVAALVCAYAGESAYSLLESAYAMPLAGLFVPLTAALYRAPKSERSALMAMGAGTLFWAIHLALGWDNVFGPALARTLPLPVALTAAALSAVCYFGSEAAAGENLNAR